MIAENFLPTINIAAVADVNFLVSSINEDGEPRQYAIMCTEFGDYLNVVSGERMGYIGTICKDGNKHYLVKHKSGVYFTVHHSLINLEDAYNGEFE